MGSASRGGAVVDLYLFDCRLLWIPPFVCVCLCEDSPGRRNLCSLAVRKAWSESRERETGGKPEEEVKVCFPETCAVCSGHCCCKKNLFLRIAALYLLSYNARFDMISKKQTQKNKQITIDEYNNPPRVLPVDAYDRWSKGSIVVRPSSRLCC